MYSNIPKNFGVFEILVKWEKRWRNFFKNFEELYEIKNEFLKHFVGNCLKYLWHNFWKNLWEIVGEIWNFQKKNVLKGNYGAILGENCERILKKFWQISSGSWNNLRKVLRNLGENVHEKNFIKLKKNSK